MQATFPNSQTLTSTARTPDDLHVIFQPLIARIFGLDPDANPDSAYSAVRVSWQQEGQPGWGIAEDICSISARLDGEAEYATVRDAIWRQAETADPLSREMGYTQVWNLHLALYGPNCPARARLILSAMALDWVADSLAANNLYVIPEWKQPTYAPELYQGQWWKRCDLDLTFNELAIETTSADAAAGMDVSILTDSGLSAEVHIGTPEQGA